MGSKILSAEVVAQVCSRVYRVVVRQTRADGREEDLVREVVDHGGAAAVLPLDPQRGTCLLVRQMRAGAFFAGHHAPLLEVCAGLLDHDDPETCARREALEELGCRVHDLTFVMKAFATPGAHTEFLHFFTATYGPEDRIAAGGGVEHEGEDIEVVEMALADAHALIATGGIVDAKTIIMLQHAWAAHSAYNG